MTEFSLILQNIAKHVHLTREEQDYFCSLLEPRKLRRREFLFLEGDICKYSSFVNQGCLRGFATDKNGTEHVLSFAPVDWWIGDIYSLVSEKPAILSAQALEATEVLMLSRYNQDQLYQNVPKFERFFRIIIENSLVANQQRLIDNMSLTAEERYLNFCKKYPTLVYCLPQKHIASYIGVTPEFFSKMRKESISRQ
ncbi:MAG: Crp/Fnr family transcriptional regulator [Lewinellaceae bacterium]|nr:Crp/Fnr family transcriptional regulator [Lewinella sp.]MCB9281478.1 Crp/Fnr family transcriptional regulator [Lewinellaceae bacterium]